MGDRLQCVSRGGSGRCVAGLLVGLEWWKVAHVAHTAGESIVDEVGVVKPGFASARCWWAMRALQCVRAR